MKPLIWRCSAALLLMLALSIIPSAAAQQVDNDAIFATEPTVYLPMIQRAIPDAAFDLVEFLAGDPILYEVQHSVGSQARHQTQKEASGPIFYHTKGENTAEWEELWFDDNFIYRGTDTSPGDGRYYTLRDAGRYGSKWAPRYWKVGEVYERNPRVTFYRKGDCGVVLDGTQLSYLKFDAYHARYRFNSGIELNRVIELSWRLTPDGEPIESYFYAAGYGLVGWGSSDRGVSYISEIHNPGARPDNVREAIGCLNRSAAADLDPFSPSLRPLPYWPGQHRR